MLSAIAIPSLLRKAVYKPVCRKRHAEELLSRSTLGVKELSKEPEVEEGVAQHGMQIPRVKSG